MNPEHPDNELHELFEGRLKIFQKKEGYRFSVDSILLAGFAAERASGTVADLGTGSGILPVILARHEKFQKITGIEIQEDLTVLARQNIGLNKCEDRVSIVHADIKDLTGRFSAGEFDTVITNPPFYTVSSGRINPNNQKALARHELHGTLRDFISAAAFLLRQSGKFFAVYLCFRIADLVTEMRRKNIEPKTFQFVHARIDEDATMVLVEGAKGAGTEAKILPPLILYDAEGNYTEEVKAVFRGI